jgi:hypothetical protein
MAQIYDKRRRLARRHLDRLLRLRPIPQQDNPILG